MKNLKSKRSLLVPVGLFTIFIIAGLFKLCRAITAHNALLGVISVVGIALSVTGLLLIIPHLRKGIKTV